MASKRWRVRCLVCDPSEQSVVCYAPTQDEAARDLHAHQLEHHWPVYPPGVDKLGYAEQDR